MGSRFIVGLDIGTSQVRLVVAENRGGKPVPRTMLAIPSMGVERGCVVDIPEASRMVGRALIEAKRIAKHSAKSVYVNLGTHQVKYQNSRGIVAVSRADAEIYHDDVDRVVRASQAVNFPPNWMIVHHVAREFIVDGIGDIVSRVGLSGSRLEVNSLLISAFSRHVKDLMRVVEVCGGHVAGIFFGPLAASRAVLTKKQRHLGTVVIDMGAGTTGISVYEGNKILGATMVPLGASHITNDIAVGLKIPVTAAEKVKLAHGYAVARDIGQKETIDLKKCDEGLEGTVSRRFVADIIEARLAEILDLVHNELKVMTKAVDLPGGAVLVGGGAKLPGLAGLMRQRLKLSSQIGLALQDEWHRENEAYEEYFEDPEFVGALGLVLSGAEKEEWRRDEEGGWSPSKRLMRFVKYFIP